MTHAKHMADLYDILGITNKSCSKSTIKKAWFRMSKKWHPDKNGGSDESTNMTTKINQAKEILIDENLRQCYDQGGIELVEQYREMVKRQDEQAKMQQPILVKFGISISDIYNNVTKKILFTRETESDDGTIKTEEDFIEIEAGNITDFHTKACLKGKGNVTPGKINGDVIVQFMKNNKTNENEIDDFDLEQGHLVLRKTINLQVLLSGKKVPVKHPNGKTYLINKKLDEPMKFHGLGIGGDNDNDNDSDMIVILKLDLSDVLSDKELRGRLLSQFDKKLPNVAGEVLLQSKTRYSVREEMGGATQCPIQ